MFDCLRELSDIIAHYERLSLRFQEEMDQLPPGCLLTRTLKNAERFYHQFRLEGKTKQVYLNAGAAARLRPLMERKKKIRRFLRAWRLCRPALRQIVRLAERLLANEELRMALLELYADSPSPLPYSSAPGWPHDRSQQEPLGGQAGCPADGLPPEILTYFYELGLCLDGLMDGYLFNQSVQKFCGQLHRVGILLHQGNPLFCVRCGLYGGFHCFVKLLDFCFKLLLLVLVLLGKHIEVILGNASGRPCLLYTSPGYGSPRWSAAPY